MTPKYPPWIVLIISEETSLRVMGKEKFTGGHTFFFVTNYPNYIEILYLYILLPIFYPSQIFGLVCVCVCDKFTLTFLPLQRNKNT
jgi:hypothetical protein